MEKTEKRSSSTGMRIGEYQLGEVIGKGGFGCVYKALDQQTGNIVAIKQVSLGGFFDQRISAGGSIAFILKKFGAFPESLCALYTFQILKGLKLADFGVATKLSEIDSSKRRVVGTPYWMAPETVEMSPPTPASDIWSVGSTVVEMVTKNPPYADLPQVSAMYQSLDEEKIPSKKHLEVLPVSFPPEEPNPREPEELSGYHFSFLEYYRRHNLGKEDKGERGERWRHWDSKESVHQLVMQHGAVPIVEMLQVPEIELQNSVLKVVNQIVAEGNRDFQDLRTGHGRGRSRCWAYLGVLGVGSKELFSMVGLIPGVIKFAHTDCQKYLRAEVGKFISHLCKSSESSLQMLVACGGLEAIVQLISSEYFYNRDLVYPALDDVNTVLLIDTLASDMGNYHQERATIYLRLVVSLLVKIAKTGDAVVKAYMAKATVLEGLIASLEFLSPPLVLETLGRPFLFLDVCTQCLLALSNLCKLSRPRQEQAALAGAIPKLQAIVERQHPWREHAFLLLCEMTCASLATRKKLWDSNGASFLVRSLAQESTQVPALEALLANFEDFLLELLRRLEADEDERPSGKVPFDRCNSMNAAPAHFPDDFDADGSKAAPVRRMISAQLDNDDAVHVRQSLLRLLLQLCQPLSKEHLATLVLRFRLKQQLRRVLDEEKRRQRVILRAIAQQLLVMFQNAAPDEGNATAHNSTTFIESPEHVKIDVEGEDHVAPEEEGRRSSERSKGGKRPSIGSFRAETELYAILGIEANAQEADIRSAYKRCALQLHPDKGGDPDKFKTMTLGR
eukprot:g9977.t1